MLEGLDKINWSQLHHAYGEASDVPVLIRRLLSQDNDQRKKAFRELLGNIWHQGTIWEASAYAIPFLWELLASPETPDKLQIVDLITTLAIGEHMYEVITKDENTQKVWKEILAERGTTIEEEFEIAQEHKQKVHEAILKEFPLLYPYILCEDPTIRNSVAGTFGEYPEFKSETLPLLEKASASENDIYAKETMENSIKILNGIEQ